MFNSVVSGKVKYDLQMKNINKRSCCNITIETINTRRKSLVRCTAFDKLSEEMFQTVKKGDYILVSGEASNVSFGSNEKFVFNIELNHFELMNK